MVRIDFKDSIITIKKKRNRLKTKNRKLKRIERMINAFQAITKPLPEYKKRTNYELDT